MPKYIYKYIHVVSKFNTTSIITFNTPSKLYCEKIDNLHRTLNDNYIILFGNCINALIWTGGTIVS